MSAIEQERFLQLESPLSAMFGSSGHAVRLCEGRDKGGSRLIRFLTGMSGDAVISIPAARFVSGSDEEVMRELADSLSKYDPEHPEQ